MNQILHTMNVFMQPIGFVAAVALLLSIFQNGKKHSLLRSILWHVVSFSTAVELYCTGNHIATILCFCVALVALFSLKSIQRNLEMAVENQHD